MLNLTYTSTSLRVRINTDILNLIKSQTLFLFTRDISHPTRMQLSYKTLFHFITQVSPPEANDSTCTQMFRHICRCLTSGQHIHCMLLHQCPTTLYNIIYILKYSESNCVLPERILESSSSSCRVISMDIPDPLLPPLPIVHFFLLVFRATSRIGTELLYVGSSWSSCLCSSM